MTRAARDTAAGVQKGAAQQFNKFGLVFGPKHNGILFDFRGIALGSLVAAARCVRR